jgi:predicted dehydrogenase
MFKTQNLDLVDICTPVSTHRKIVCDSAEEVPSILVEKPMALTLSDCDAIIEKIRSKGTKLCIGHNQLFSPNVLKARALVDSGTFKVSSFKTTQKESFRLLNTHDLAPQWNVEPAQRGIIWEVCAHLAYLQLHFLPDINEVYALGGKVQYPVYDNFDVLLRTSDKRFGLIELSWFALETEIVWELSDPSGRRLQIIRDYDYLQETSLPPPFSSAGVLKNVLVEEKRLLNKWGRFGHSYFRKRKVLPTFNLITRFLDSIKTDSQVPVTPEEGRNTIRLLEAIEKSLDEKRPVTL